MEKALTNCALVLAPALCGLACASGRPASSAEGRPAVVLVPAAVASSSEGLRAPSPPVAACRERALITQGDREENALNARAGFSGHWYTYADRTGTHVVPWPASEAGGGFSLSPGGVHSAYAPHMLGQLAKGDVVFAGMGANFLDPKAPFDASGFSGIELWVKVGADSSTHVRFLLPDQNTDPDGKVCTECFNHFGSELVLHNDWSLQQIRFAELEQQPDWGAPHPVGIETSALYGFELRVTEPDATFDVWVDDMRFTGCEN